jgi:hypothetical protein
LRYTRDVSVYLDNLRELNQVIASAAQAFRDQVEIQLTDKIITMMYMRGLILDDDDDFLQIIESEE